MLHRFYTTNMYTVYILQCADGTFYAGSTTNLAARLHTHNHTKAGAKYTRARRPVVVVFTQRCRTLAKARQREAALKRLTRAEKLELIKNYNAAKSNV